MKFIIKKRTTDEIMFEGEADSFKDFVVLHKANLRGADLQEANLRGADLRGADLQEANLRGADLWRADLWRADLRGANLRGADLWRADFWGAKITITQKEDLLKATGIVIESN